MGRFFAVNPAVAVALAMVGVSVWGTAFYYYDKVYGWQGAEGVAAARFAELGISGEHCSTTDHGDEVRVLYAQVKPGHYVDMTVKRGQDGKWAVTKCNKDFAPCADDDQASH